MLIADRPDARGRFGPYGGQFVPETLIQALRDLERAMEEALADPEFVAHYEAERATWIGRPTALTDCTRLSEAWGARILAKREDLAHTGAHKINNALGQALIAKRRGIEHVVAETGAGQHGVATAAACARVGLRCTIYMGAVDVSRQAPNVRRMRQFGAEVVPVHNGDATLRAAIDEALRAWVTDPVHTTYLLGSAVGPHPYPLLVRTLQSVIGDEARAQCLERTGELPDAAIACVGGGSNAIGLFHPFRHDASVRLVGVEAGGSSKEAHAATVGRGTPGVLHGSYSLLLQTPQGQIRETHSVSAGLDYPGVGPEHAELARLGRATYVSIGDAEALAALREVAKAEGILVAIETAHAFAEAKRQAAAHPGTTLLVCCSGRGDKDLEILAALENA